MAEKQSRDTRQTVFISHATPEDNRPAAWVATRLALLGYDVWCDVANTSVGESEFWYKIQSKIENDTAKFVYLLSNHSCDIGKKRGLARELQAALNLNIDNFILPVIVSPLTRSVPILINTSIYGDGQNWASALREIVRRLTQDGVPKARAPDIERVSQWWPAINVEDLVRSHQPETLVSNELRFEALPKNIFLYQAISDGNVISGRDPLTKVLLGAPPWYAHRDYFVSLSDDLLSRKIHPGFHLRQIKELDTLFFLEAGCSQYEIQPTIAKNIVTYLVSQHIEGFLSGRGLLRKPIGRKRRAPWYISKGLLPNDRIGISEKNRRKSSVQLVGKFSHRGKLYQWHFGILPAVDLELTEGIVLRPKLIVTKPQEPGTNEHPAYIDDKKILAHLSWWNKQWRQKLVGLVAFLSTDRQTIQVQVGSQVIEIASKLETFEAQGSCSQLSDDEVIDHIMDAIYEKNYTNK